MHNLEQYATTAVGGAVGSAMAAANGNSLLSIDWSHTLEYGINILLGTVIVTVLKLAADGIMGRYTKSKGRRPKNATPRRNG